MPGRPPPPKYPPGLRVELLRPHPHAGRLGAVLAYAADARLRSKYWMVRLDAGPRRPPLDVPVYSPGLMRPLPSDRA